MSEWNAHQMIAAPFQKRAIDSFVDHPGLTEQLLAVQGLTANPWRGASIKQALGVPAIQRAVSLISNTVGSLTVQGFRGGLPMDDPPRIVQRPDPFNTPREFYRDTAYYIATRGEAIWWIAARDGDNTPASLIVVPLAELSIEENPNNRAFPIYSWGKKKSHRFSPATPNGDFVHITYLKEPGTLRGVGPLQLCGAAVSVTVEAQEWAANFFAGDTSSTELQSQVDITQSEADQLVDDWVRKARSNMPKVTNPTVKWIDHTINPQSAQMTEARSHQDGEAARMFGIPGSLLEYSSPGSSLTYQNVEQEYTKFVRTCLSPYYLEPIEQALSDLLPRSTVARFYVEGLLRADIKTRFAVYESAIKVFGVEEGAQYARVREGLAAGNVEVAPVPYAFPQAVPASIPNLRSQELTTQEPHPATLLANAVMALATREQVAPNITVNPAPITVNPPSVTVEPAHVTFERGAFQVDATDMAPLSESITKLAERPTNVTIDVAAPDMSGVSEAMHELATRPQEPAQVTFEEGAFSAPEVHVAPAEVTFAKGSITAPVSVQPASVTLNVPEPRATRKKLTRDADGQITEIVEVPA